VGAVRAFDVAVQLGRTRREHEQRQATLQILLPVAIAIYGWMLLAGKARLIRFNGMFVIGLLFSLCIAISIWYGSEFLGQTAILSDYYELPKAWLPVAFFTLAYEAELPDDSLRRLVKFFGAAILLVCVFAWTQWAGLSVSYTLNAMYSSGNHDDALMYARRVYATMMNPNLLGQLVTWAMAAFALAALAKVGNRAWNIALAFACLVTLSMTGSRYGLFNGCLTFALIVALPSASRRRRNAQRTALLLIVPILALTYGAISISNHRSLERFETLRNPMQADSVRLRLEGLWVDAFDAFKQSPFFGRGPAKTIFNGIYTDSEYLDVLKRFGIIGFMSYIAYFLFPLFLLGKGLQASQRAGPLLEQRMPATLMTLRLCAVMAIMAVVMNIGMSTFYNAQLQGLLWMWLGLGARCAKTIGDLPARRREPWGVVP
jgi:hypothetical protein